MGLDMGTSAAISGGGSLLGGLFGKNSASSAANAQLKAAQQAQQLQAQMFGYTAGQLSPFVNGGVNNLLGPYYGGASQGPQYTDQYLQPITNSLYSITNPGQVTTGATTPIVTPNTNAMYATPTTTLEGVQNWGLGADQQKALEATPGYQFTKDQGLAGVQNSAAASGRGVSGNALAGAANFATGLANNTFNQQFQNMLTGQQQAYGQQLSSTDQLLRSLAQQFTQQLGAGTFQLGAQQQGWQQGIGSAQLAAALENQLYGQQKGNFYDPLSAMLAGLGLSENAAAMSGNQGVQYANAGSNLITGAGNATASGIIGGANALTGGLGGATNALSNYALMNQLFATPSSSNNSISANDFNYLLGDNYVA